MKVLLFGTGDYYERYKIWFDRDDIIALIDNSSIKQNTAIDGIRVLSPKEATKLSFDAIIIMSFYINAMKKQLVELNVNPSKIYHFYDLHDLLYEKIIKRKIYCYNTQSSIEKKELTMPSKRKNDRKVLLLSQDLTYGGPALALFHAAEILIKHGFQVTYASMIDGPLREKILSNGISVVVDENLLINTMNEVEWIRDFSFIICNTINYHVFLSDRDISIPVIWWLHDSAFFYDGVNKDAIKKINRTNLHICSVGQVPERQIEKYIQEISVNNRLLYGVTDSFSHTVCGKIEKDKVIFVTVGYIEERKGQDILVEAIKLLPPNIRNKAVFYFIGQNTSMLAQKLNKEIIDVPEIIMTGPVDRNAINEFLTKADAMICPSREDPMPTVAAEAMMHEVACLVSDATGTADYITDKEDGLIFSSENINELCRDIEWCVINKDKLPLLGKKARKIYENKFSIHAFETALMNEVNHVVD